jgi:hypothetical protein
MYTVARLPAAARSALGGRLRFVKEYMYAFRTLLFRGHRRHWQKIATGGVPGWDVRNEVIAAAIPANSSVVDLGCGARTLQSHLRAGCTYRPFDFVRNSPSVEFCDCNAGIYPHIENAVDYIVCSGLLEYIRDPREFLGRIAPLGRKICLSYNPVIPGETRRSRLAKRWVNHITQTELEQIFTDLHFTWRVINRRPPNEFTYMLAHNGTR